MRIIRVFPRRTSYTPVDEMVFVNEPPGLFIPEHDEVHISCVFTWDKVQCEWLRCQWAVRTDKPVRLGGPAYGSPCGTFTPGFYVKKGIVFTSRGCNNSCPWCFVPLREGRLKELPICEGNIIQDNNFLQTSRAHKDKVFAMLRGQRAVSFKGGLQNNLIDSHFIDNIQKLKISSLWLACDNDNALPGLVAAVEKLKRAGFSRCHIYVYTLIGDCMEANEARLRAIFNAGAKPFAQLYQPPENNRREYSGYWKRFARKWSRPALTNAHMRNGATIYRNEFEFCKKVIEERSGNG
ncbi:MAG: hypothetical protein LBB56_02960 [Chitinispirillales bacterium]|jgi:hypothetical protein|nr:hypothetical protein [Chitinispirillales bacterium]